MCRTYGAGILSVLGSRRFRTGLTYDAPPALVRHEIVRLPKLTTENRERSLVGAKLHRASVGMTT